MHNYLQESFSRMVEFKGLGSILGYLEGISVMVFSSFERWLVGETGRKVARSDYMQLTACLFGTSYLSTVGLDYISYPTKVVFRSCKLIPTMLLGTFINRRVFSLHQYLSAAVISLGLLLFVAVVGIIFSHVCVCVYVCVF